MTTKMMRAKHGWTHVAFVASLTEDDLEYEIKRHDDGHLGCACHAYVFSKTKEPCKHIEAFKLDASSGGRTLLEEARMLAAQMAVEVCSRVDANVQDQMRAYLRRKLEWFVTDKVGEERVAAPAKSATVSVGLETFTVRRAISLTPLTAKAVRT